MAAHTGAGWGVGSGGQRMRRRVVLPCQRCRLLSTQPCSPTALLPYCCSRVWACSIPAALHAQPSHECLPHAAVCWHHAPPSHGCPAPPSSLLAHASHCLPVTCPPLRLLPAGCSALACGPTPDWQLHQPPVSLCEASRQLCTHHPGTGSPPPLPRVPGLIASSAAAAAADASWRCRGSPATTGPTLLLPCCPSLTHRLAFLAVQP